MKINEVVVRNSKDNVYDFHWDNDRGGFAVTVDDEEVAFHKAKDPKWDRGGAQELAKKNMLKLRSDAIMKRQAEEEYKYQYEKPLTDLEQKWVEMTNRFMSLNDDELHRWKLYAPAIRKSLLNGTHQSLTKQEPLRK